MDRRIPRPGYGFRHFVLTIEAGDNPADRAYHLLKSFRLLRKIGYWRRMVSGGAFVIEISGAPGKYHVHIHAVIEAKYMSRNLLISKWKRISGGRGIFIKTLNKGAIVHYLTKYIVKPCSEDIQTKEISDILKSFRLFQTFGDWHKDIRPYVKVPYPCPKCKNSWWLPIESYNPIRGFAYQTPTEYMETDKRFKTMQNDALRYLEWT